MNDALGDRMKAYEDMEAGRRLLPLVPALARIDGRCFSSFTRGLGRPYDANFSALMIELTKYLVKETNAVCGYTQSDEITLAWYSPDRRSEIFFDGRIQKMVSVLGSTAAYFLSRLPEYLPPEYAAKLPTFDARVWSVPTLEEGANCFLWREWDATKNSITMAAQEHYSHKEIHGVGGADKQEMLFRKGVNWNDYPDFFKRGSYVQRRVTSRKFTAAELDKLPPLHEARANPELTVERTDYARIEMPPLGKVINRVGVIYSGEEPRTEAK